MPFCLRESHCFFSQRHGATVFMIVGIEVPVRASIIICDQHSSSVPLRLRESHCVFSQRHRATEFLFVGAEAPVSASIIICDQRFSSVSLCLRETHCFFSQRHRATEFLFVGAEAPVSASIIICDQRFSSVPLCLRETHCFSHRGTEPQSSRSSGLKLPSLQPSSSAVSTLPPCLCASVRPIVFLTEARSHRVPGRRG